MNIAGTNNRIQYKMLTNDNTPPRVQAVDAVTI